ncbi:AbrB family transcriptional regulator [Roseinatronobacter monicus]|uniref:AbrB family transcriptional regulator n=1 Tax=Roseinatronobacter monicus TaxID=393481 RepID=UPI003F34F73B
MQVHPGLRDWRLWVKFALTLMVAIFGALLFEWLLLPLPWMLGSMTLVTLGAVLRLKLFAPARIRPPMTAIIGVLLGASFSPSVLDNLLVWLPTLLGLVVFSAMSGLCCAVYLHKIAGFDRVTAFFGGMPGGLVEMIELGSERGADERAVALMHSARILLVVFSLPFILQLLEGVPIAEYDGTRDRIMDAPLSTFAWLLVCAVVGSRMGRLLRLPAKDLMGPMLLSAILHVGGLTEFTPPTEIVNLAQLIIGTVLGVRFVGVAPRLIGRMLAIAFGMTVIMIGIVFITAIAVGATTGIPLATLVLAYAPGGLAEMSLVALALNADVAFVATHHLARILLVMLGAAPIYALLVRLTVTRAYPAPDKGGAVPPSARPFDK